MSRPLRFLHVTTFYPPYHFGGDGLYVYRLAHELADRGHTVDVVHCADSYRLLAGGEPTARFSGHPGVTVHTLESRFGWLSPLLSHQTGQPLLKRAALARLLKRPFDVVHFHNVSLFGPGVLSLGGRRSFVRLYTVHEHWLVCPTSVLWKFNERPCEGPTCIRCTIAAGRPPQLWRFTPTLSRAARSVDRFLAPSHFTARMHAERGFDRPMTHLPPFSARRDEEWRVPGPRPHPRPYFLYVGRLEILKGVRALAAIWDRVPGADLVFVGDGSQRTELEALAKRDPRIVVHGPVPPDALGPYYVHAIACVVPSLVYEVAPTVVLEAFARKTPVVARDLGGTSELAGEGGGILYTTDDELVAALAGLAASPETRAALAEVGYAAFERRWTTAVHLAAYLRLIDEVAEQKAGGPRRQAAGEREDR